MEVPVNLLSFLSSLTGFIFTVLILSYLLGDNPLFRVGIYLFIGISVGYVLSVTWHQVIWPQLIQPMISGAVFRDIQQAFLIFPLLGSVLLLVKIFPRLSGLGQLPTALLVGVGAAVAVGGAILGTLIPQVEATVNAFDLRIARTNAFFALFNGVLVLIGILGTLAYFQFGARKREDGTVRRNALIEALTWIGRIYIAISFGVLFAGVYLAALTAFISRVDSINDLIDALGKLF
jgi:hypothetical protein